jgi:hypothetical protein
VNGNVAVRRDNVAVQRDNVAVRRDSVEPPGKSDRTKGRIVKARHRPGRRSTFLLGGTDAKPRSISPREIIVTGAKGSTLLRMVGPSLSDRTASKGEGFAAVLGRETIMTEKKDLKTIIRDRMAKTSESVLPTRSVP